MERNRLSNYEKMKERMAAAFLQYSQREMILKFSLAHNETYLYLDFVGRNYRIHRQTGAVTWSEDAFQSETAADYNEAMTIYDVLCYSKENYHLANEWVDISSLSSIQGGSLTKDSNFFQNAGAYFDGKADSLAHACRLLHGRKIQKGDVAYELDLFPFLPLSLHFWESDEEFPASLQILADKNILDYMHYETLMFAVTHLLNRLKSQCGSTHSG
ncbi:MAG: DUF3786 domain-containing protein [Lachnospiraceae bacterium]|nr:DUF3786 domain-containing protein [Lachnospiraceae bacterium]